MRSLLNRLESADDDTGRTPLLVTQLAVDEGRTDGYRPRLATPQIVNSASSERTHMSSPLRRVRDDEERLSAPGFQRSPSSRLLVFRQPALTRRARKLAEIEAANEHGAALLEAIMDNMLGKQAR
jgi:hypothetical protein